MQSLDQCRFENCGLHLSYCPVETRLTNCEFNKTDDAATTPYFTSLYGSGAILERGCKYNKPEVPRAQSRPLP